MTPAASPCKMDHVLLPKIINLSDLIKHNYSMFDENGSPSDPKEQTKITEIKTTTRRDLRCISTLTLTLRATDLSSKVLADSFWK